MQTMSLHSNKKPSADKAKSRKARHAQRKEYLKKRHPEMPDKEVDGTVKAVSKAMKDY